MARFYTDFSTDTLGQLPAGTELKRSAVVGDYQIVNDGGVKTLRFARSAGAQSARGLRYSNVSSSGRVELYASIRDENTNPASARLVAYASDSPDNEYGCYLNGQASLNVYKRVAGGFSFLGTVNIPQGNEYWDVRFQVEPGTPNVIRAKTWLSTLSEPASWDIETTDESFDLEAGTQVGGWIGHVGFDDNPFVFFREIGIGTDGDSAPTQAITIENQTINIASISSAEQFGSTVISPGVATISSSSIDSAEHVSQPGLMSGSVSLYASSILTEEQFGNLMLNADEANITSVSITSMEQFGNHELLPAAALIVLSGIPSSEHVSEAVFYAGGSAVFAESIDGAEQFGDASFVPGQVSISVLAIDSEAIVSSPELLAGPAVIYAGSVPSAELFGDLEIFNVQQLIRLDGISTAEAFGSTTLEGGADLSGWLTGRLNIKPALTASVGVNRVH